MPFRPRLTLLSEEDVHRIHVESLRLLEETGMTLHYKEALDLLARAGAQIDYETKRALIPASLVEDQLKQAPKKITVYTRDGKPSMDLTGDNVYFNPGSAATHLLDRNTGERRHPTTRDVIDFIRVVDALPYIDAQSTALIPTDVPNILSDRFRLYLVMKYSTKPIITGTFALDAFADMQAMLEVMAGGPKRLKDKPRAIFDCCPSAPLHWSTLTVHDLIEGAKAGIPVETISMPQLGATGPVTLAGALVLHNAESLSGLVLAQLAAKGAPVIYGGSPTAIDMRYGTARLGAIENIMLTIAYTQMAKFYGLPTHGYLGLSDAKQGADAQTGYEAATGFLLGALAGVNNIAGAGMLCFESTQSFEKLVLDNVICGMAKRLVNGVAVTNETLAIKELQKVGKEGGDFLRLNHTLTWFRREHFLPDELVDRQPYESWLAQGSKNSLQRAQEYVEKTLKTHQSEMPSVNQQIALDEIVQTFMKRYEVHKLPQFPS